MDPRRLLDPKGYAKEMAKKKKEQAQPKRPAQKANTLQNSAANNGPTPNFDPRVLLNPRTTILKSLSTSQAASATSNSENYSFTAPEDNKAEGPGMTNLIEKLHHVKKRDSELSLKRKPETNNEDEETGTKKSKSTFNGSGGVIRQHLNEMREQHASTNGTQSSKGTQENVPIDLTEDNDDDDVQIVEEKKNEMVCLGIIPVKASMSRLPTVNQQSINSVGRGFFPRVRLTYRRIPGANKNIDLLDRNDKLCGKLALQAATAFAPLIDGTHMNKATFTFYLNAHSRGDNPTAPGSAISEILRASVIIHAPQTKAEMIGSWLSHKQFFLHAPPDSAAGRYRNPQEPQNSSDRPLKSGAGAIKTIVRTEEEVVRDVSSVFDALVSHDDLPDMEADEKYISTPLLQHQKQGLHFMTNHELENPDSNNDTNDVALWKYERLGNGQDSWYHIITGHQVFEKPEWPLGGLLADMMGLGKTLQVLALAAATREQAAYFANHAELPSGEVSPVEANLKATLIVCPKSVMSNWSEQIKAHGKPGKWRVLQYHGVNRTQDLHELGKYHVILTTYQTLANEFKGKYRALARVCFYRVVLDEAHTIRNQESSISIACCKIEATRRWAATGTPVQNRLEDLGALFKFMAIKPFNDPKNWTDHITKRFKAGDTKVIADLRLLVDSVTIRRLKDKINLPGRKVFLTNLEFSSDEQAEYTRIARKQNLHVKRITMRHGGQFKGRAYAEVLKSISRMRMYCAHGLEMFSEETRLEMLGEDDPDNVNALDLGDDRTMRPFEFLTEKQAYEAVQVAIDGDNDQCFSCGTANIGTKKKNNRSADEDESSDDVATEDEDDEDEDDETAAANDELGCLTACLHLLCPSCKKEHIAKTVPTLYDDQYHKCPMCTDWVPFAIFDLYYSTLQEYIDARANKLKRKNQKYDESTYSGPHTKVKALLEQLEISAQETAALPAGEPPIRSVVFSGWTTYLDLISIALEDKGHKYVRLDGTMSIKARSAVLEEFKKDPSVTVMLISIKAGGQGLNLTSASKVYMMEPQWNPGVEQQAIDRVHRLGQERDVTITHFIMKDSVEQGILKLQKQKEDLANLSLERKKMTKVEEAQQRLAGLKALFK